MAHPGGGSGGTVSGDGCTSMNTCREQSAVIGLDPQE